jgi:hypothetical protein
MLLTGFLSVLSLFLAVACVISVYKNLMAERRNINGAKITIIVLLIVAALCGSLFSGSHIFELRACLNMVNSPNNYDPKDVALAAQSIPGLRANAIKLLIFGYAAYIVQFFYANKLRKNIDEKIIKEKKGKWTYK